MKLHLGCGPRHLEGYVNIDMIETAATDQVLDVVDLELPDGCASEILAEHLIEHLTYYQFNRAIANWTRILAPGGCLELECPDLEAVCKLFADSTEYARYTTSAGYWPIIAQIYGHQRGGTPEAELSQVHKSGYTEAYLRYVLTGLGYVDITRGPAQRVMPGAPGLRLLAWKPL